MTGSAPGTARTGVLALTAAMGCCVMLVLGMVSAVNLAIPALSASSLRPSASAVLWIVDGYVVVFACLLVPAGAVADRLGRKGVLLAGLVVFGAGCALCASAPTAAVLIAGRVISGAGAAAVLPSTLALLIAGAPQEQRPRLVSIWASMTGLAVVFGNLGGGAALTAGSWRVLFGAALPLVVVAGLAVCWAAPVVSRNASRIDAAGAGLLTAGVLGVLFAVISGPGSGWSGTRVLVPGLTGAALLVLWVVRGLRTRDPLLDPRLFTLPAVRASAAGMALIFAGMFAVFLVNGQYLQHVLGTSPLGAGVRLLPMAVALLLAPRFGVALAGRGGQRLAAAVGLLLLVSGLACLAAISARTTYGWYALGITLAATGCGLVSPVFSHSMVAALPDERSGSASGLQGLTRELGSAVGVAGCGSLLAGFFTAALPPDLRGRSATVAGALAEAAPQQRTLVLRAFTEALGSAMSVLAALVLLASVAVVLWLPRSPGSPRPSGGRGRRAGSVRREDPGRAGSSAPPGGAEIRAPSSGSGSARPGPRARPAQE